MPSTQRSSSPPKRRASDAPAVPNKTSKMSAEAPVFQPRTAATGSAPGGKDEEYDPAVAASSSNAAAANSGEGRGAAELSDETRAALNAAVSAARVTRPLPNSRRAAPAANFVPQAATVAKTGEEKENRRRLIVVLSQVRRGRWRELNRTEMRCSCVPSRRISSGPTLGLALL